MTKQQNTRSNKRKYSNQSSSEHDDQDDIKYLDIWLDPKKRKIEEETETDEEETLSDYDDTSSIISSEDQEEPTTYGDQLKYGKPNLWSDPFLSEFSMTTKLQYETKMIFSKLPEYCWSIIYSYAGMESFFANRLYNLNSSLKENLLESKLFWEAISKQLFPKISNTNCKGYLFWKYIAFEIQNQLNPSYYHGAYRNDIYQTKNIDKSFTNSCFITEMEYTGYCFKVDGLKVFAAVDWTCNVFLSSCPKIVGLSIVANGGCIAKDLFSITAYVGDTPIMIFDKNSVVLVGVKKLFESLQLDESYLENLEMPTRFAPLEFGELKQNPYFIWFCHSILDHVPYPIEELYKYNDFNKLSFGVDDSKNRIAEKYLKYSHKVQLYYKSN